MKKRIAIDTADRELRAHVYQQIALLEPQLRNNAQVHVVLSQEDKESGEAGEYYEVELRIEVDGETIQVDAVERTPYLAMNLARHNMQAILAEVQSLGERGVERQSAIQSIIENITVH